MSAGSDVTAHILAQLRTLMGTQSRSEVRVGMTYKVCFPFGRLKGDDCIRLTHMNRIVDNVRVSPVHSTSTQFPSGLDMTRDGRTKGFLRTMMPGYTEDPLVHDHRPIRSFRIR